MSLSPEPRITSPLTDSDSPPETTVQVPSTTSTAPLLSPNTGVKMPTLISTAPLSSPNTSVKMPIVIPASNRRVRTDSLPIAPAHKRHIVLPGVLIGSLLIITLASVFVVPLGNSLHTATIAQDIGGLFTNSQSNAIGTSQQVVTPTVNQISSGDTQLGACRGSDIWSTCATYTIASRIQATGQMQHPLAGAIITQVFGHPEYQLWCGCWKPHTGIDLAAPYGTPIMAADTGQVIWVGWDWSGLGWAVKINHGNFIATIYGHMDHFIVKVGQNVSKGQIIGYEGSTGASTGPHVHFMVLLHNVWVNPQLYVQLP